MTTVIAGTGSSELDDAFSAGAAAATTAIADLQGQDPALVLVYSSVRYDLEAMLSGVRSVTGTAPLAGATSSGHFLGDRVVDAGQGVAVLVMTAGDYHFGVASAQGMAARPLEVGMELTRAARTAAHAADFPHAALLLLTDGIGVDQQAVLSGVHRVCGSSVPVVGGAAADDLKMERTSVFHDDAVLGDGAVGIWIASPRPLVVASAHGWSPISVPEMVTRTEGHVVHEIAGRLAGQVYGEYAVPVPRASEEEPVPAAAEASSQANGKLYQQPSFALGVLEPDGSHLVRGVGATAEGWLNSFSPLPAFSAVQVMTADPSTLLDVVDGIAQKVVTTGAEGVLLAFDCIARKDILGVQASDEVERLQRAAGKAVPFGFYTYGEFARTHGSGGVHNATLTAIAL